MAAFRSILNLAAAAFFLTFVQVLPSVAGQAELDALFKRLATPDLVEWQAVEQEIWKEWSHSGSDAMDLLLERGRAAMAEGDYEGAIEHLTALTDHAPEFAEGWNARATAYFHAGLYGPSIADIQRTLALNPRHFGAMAGLGAILIELGDEEEALKVFRRAHEIHPNRPDLMHAIERLAPKVDGTEL